MASDVRRLHPVSPLFRIGAAARTLLLPGLLVLFASRRGYGETWLMLAFVPAVVGTLVQYWSYRYRLEGDELVIREGIVTRNERHVPYSRIQNIDLVQNPLHRLLGVAEVRVETAGGEKPEAVMRVLSLEAVERMRASVFKGRASATAQTDGIGERAVDAAPSGPERRVVYSMSAKDVLWFGLVSNKGMVVIAAALGLFWQLDVWERWTSSVNREWFDRVQGLLPVADAVTLAFLAVAAFAVVFLLMRILSVVWAFFKFHGFRLVRVGEDLQVVYGLLTRVSQTIPRRRIQQVSIRAGWAYRRLGCVALQVQTAGGGSEDGDTSARRLWLAPLLLAERARELLAEVLPGIEVQQVGWEPLSPRARSRLFRQSVYLIVPLTVAAVWGFGAWGLVVPAVCLPWAWVHARRWTDGAGYALTERALLFRSGWWVRRTCVVTFGKVQVVELTQSPFDRRRRMAAVRVDTAGSGAAGPTVEIPYLDAPVAARVSGRLSLEAGRTRFEW